MRVAWKGCAKREVITIKVALWALPFWPGLHAGGPVVMGEFDQPGQLFEGGRFGHVGIGTEVVRLLDVRIMAGGCHDNRGNHPEFRVFLCPELPRRKSR